VSTNIGERDGNGKSPATMTPMKPRPRAHRRTTECNVVEDLIAVGRSDELLNALGRVCKGTRSVPVPVALAADRQVVEQMLGWRLDCEPAAVRDEEFARERLPEKALHGIARLLGPLAGRRARALSQVPSGWRPKGTSTTSDRASAKAAAPTPGGTLRYLESASEGGLGDRGDIGAQ
jgi:hypothetical protein